MFTPATEIQYARNAGNYKLHYPCDECIFKQTKRESLADRK